MPCITFPIDPIGPIIEIGVSQPRSQIAQGTPFPQITWIKAIADTGCTNTSVHTSIAAACSLNVVGKVPVASTMQTAAANVYLADVFIRFPIGTSFYDWQFADVSMLELLHPSPNFKALLGMDILNQGAFFINGGMKQATFCC